MNKLIVFGFLVIAVVMSSCQKDEDDHDHDHEVMIEFLEPTNDETVSTPENVHVHIRISVEEGEIHDVEIKLHPEGNEGDLIIDHDAHSHETSYDFEGDYDLSSYPAGTEFHLSVKVAKDHDGTQFEEEDIHFKLP